MPWNRAQPLVSMDSVRHAWRVSVGPVVEPVSVEDLKLHARIDSGFEDSKLQSYLTAARIMLEKDTRRAFCTQTVVVAMDFLPTYIVLPVAPVQSITSITYYDSLNVQQTLASTEYESDLYAEPALIRPAFGKTWPTTYERFNAVELTAVVGYGAASAVPEDAKQAMRLLASHWYRYGEAVADNVTHDVKLSYDALVGRLKWGDYA
jgi:uncharacterized phiE125 gp8 family phage protein